MQLFFDFDGTLADSSPGIYASFQLACYSLNLEAPPYETFCDSIGPPVQLLARRFFPDLTQHQAEDFRQLFRHDYDTIRFRQCHWYEGVKSTIQELKRTRGARLVIITNKPTQPTLELLSAGGLSEHFELVVGIDYQVTQGTGPAFANKSEAIALVLSRLSHSDTAAIYVGDTPADRHSSLSCGLEFIAATYGFHRWQQDELCATPSIARISDLIPLLQSRWGCGQAAHCQPDT
ncbi:MAG: HAD family hydrolase [Synechococcaceae cyanobacterium]